MARRRIKARRAFGRKARRMARRAGIGSGKKLIQIDAMAYGAIRPKIAQLIAPLVSKLPFGSYADEVGMGLVNWFVAKKMGGMIGQIATKGLTIENAMIGSNLSSTFLNGGSTTTPSNNSLWVGGY